MPGPRGVIVVAAAVLASGCTSAAGAAVSSTVSAFLGAVARGDTRTACALLTPRTLRRMEALRPEGCVAALGTLGLPTAEVRDVVVWGDAARARTSSDTLFLRELGQGWRISAVGCVRRGDQPYDCVLEGA